MKKPKSPFGTKSPEGLEMGRTGSQTQTPLECPDSGYPGEGDLQGGSADPRGRMGSAQASPPQDGQGHRGTAGKGRDAGGDGAAMGKSGALSPGAGGERPGAADPGQLRQPGPRRVTPAPTSQRQQMRERGSHGGGRKSTPGKRIAAKGPGRRREPPRNFPARGGAAGHCRTPGTSRTLPGSSRTGTY